jgi:5-(aminomethyl)-3-furanmethanol phosphate kinase
MSPKIPTRVIKLGGSLLDWPPWPARFRTWLSEQPPAANVLVVGGGKLADEVRQRDRTEQLDPITAHWLAIDAMAANMAVVRQLLPEAIPADRYEELPELLEPGVLIAFCPRDFLRRIEPHLPGETLPHSWDVTSDSIAARLACLFNADELILLKSVSPPANCGSLAELADAGYLDRGFPAHAKRLPKVRLCNLRTEKPREDHPWA